MRTVIFRFAGGPWDGKIVTGEPQQEGEARECYTLSYHGRLGQQFRVATEYTISILASGQRTSGELHHFPPHIYEVVERIANRHVLLVRAEYVQRGTDENGKPSL